MWSLLLFAQTREDPFRRPEVIWGVVGLTVALLAGAAVIYGVDRWRKRAMAGATDVDEAGSLTSFRDMFENGEITETEYAELRRRVADKVKKKPAVALDETGPSPAPSRPVSSPRPNASNAPTIAPTTDSSPPPASPGEPGTFPEPPPPPSSA